jgi:uncharacterized spore protein YtfJ
MIDTKNEVFSARDKREEYLPRVLEKLYAAAQPGAVFSEPVTSGNYTVIMASEVAAGGGFGSGSGFGPFQKKANEQSPELQQPESGGSGIGGGGGSSGRPVAIIVIGPEGVTVKPVFDITKIALAGITVWGTMLMLLRKMRRGNTR